MKLGKHDPQTEMEVNMTPMIDVVFLLIIFFMIITDMTQQELEDLQLPVALTAVHDEPDPKEIRPIVNVLYNGEIIVKKETLYDPEAPDDYKLLAADFSDKAAQMHAQGRTEPLNDDGTGPQIPSDPLLIRADQVTSFRHIQKIMEVCGRKGIQIWKVQLAAAEAEKDDQE